MLFISLYDIFYHKNKKTLYKNFSASYIIKVIVDGSVAQFGPSEVETERNLKMALTKLKNEPT